MAVDWLGSVAGDGGSRHGSRGDVQRGQRFDARVRKNLVEIHGNAQGDQMLPPDTRARPIWGLSRWRRFLKEGLVEGTTIGVVVSGRLC